MYRQGEILLVPVEKPQGLRSTPMQEVVLGHGETGNAHVVIGEDLRWLHHATVEIDALKKDGALSTRANLFIEVGENAEVIHRAADEGHRGFSLPPGVYSVHIDTEVQWWTNEVKRMVD